jgi:hypothetical protein
MSDKTIAASELEAQTEKLFDELIQQQERKLLRLAQELRPNVTWDDLLQPQDLPEVAGDPTFNYEDGLLAGIKAARIALRARVLGPLR